MINGKKVMVIMPAYNADKTLIKTYNEIPKEVVDNIILTDDASTDRTVEIAKKLNLKLLIHDKNKGYGANQKTCYKVALEAGADIVIMLHADYQYSPKLIPAIAHLLTTGDYDVVLASKILGKGALKGGMPLYKYISNRILTFIENILLNQKLSEYHTGYRAYSKEVLENIPFMKNSDDFIFDNEILAQITFFGYRIAELSCPTKYFSDASSINLRGSIKYGFGVLGTSLKYLLHKYGIRKFSIFIKD